MIKYILSGTSKSSHESDDKFSLTVQLKSLEQCKKAYKDQKNINENQVINNLTKILFLIN